MSQRSPTGARVTRRRRSRPGTSAAAGAPVGLIDTLKNGAVFAVSGVQGLGSGVASVTAAAVRRSVDVASRAGADVARAAIDVSASSLRATTHLASSTAHVVGNMVGGAIATVTRAVEPPLPPRARRRRIPRRAGSSSRA